MIPAELKQINRWMYNDIRNNAPADRNGRIVSYTNANNWNKYNEKTKVFILKGDFTCIDFDHCLDENGNLQEWAKSFVNPFLDKGYYVEYSRSKKGLHIFGRNAIGKNLKIKMNEISSFKYLGNKAGIDILTSHAITLTGNVYQNNYSENLLAVNGNFHDLYKKLENFKKKPVTTYQVKYNSENDFDTVKNNVTIKDIFSYYGLHYSEHKNIRCPFPGHDDKEPSFRIDASKNTYNCFSKCNGGSVIDFVMKMENSNKKEALDLIMKSFNLKKEIKDNNRISEITQNVNLNEKKTLQDIFDEINQYISDLKNEDYELSDSCFLSKDFKSGFYMTEKGFCKRYTVKDEQDKDNKLYADKVIMPMQIFPTKIYLVNGYEEIEYNNKILVENDSFSTPAKFKAWSKLFSKTLWFDGTTQDIVGLEKYISIYRKFTKMKAEKAKTKLGWNGNTFAPYNDVKIFVKNKNFETENLIKSFNKKGNFDKWKEYILKYSANDIFRAYINTSLAASLVSKYKRPSFWLHNAAKHTVGKTPATFAAASIYADPSKYVTSFNTTRVGLEFRADFQNNTPIIFDDLSNLDDFSKKHISTLIYDITNGSGKKRGTVRGDMQELKNWCLCMLTTGENELLTGREYEGATKRLMSFSGSPFDNILFARESRNIFLNNYGFAGPIYTKLLVKYEKEFLKQLELIELQLQNSINYPTHIQNMATMALTDYILNTYILEIDKNKSFINALEWSIRVLKLLPLQVETDKVEIGLELVKEYIIANRPKFDDCPTGRVGFFKKNEKAVYFFPHEFRKLLQQWDIPEKRFLKEIKDREETITTNGQFKPIKFNGSTIRPIAFYHDLDDNWFDE